MSLVVNTSRPLYMHFSYVTVRNEFYESCSYYFFMYKDGKRFSALQKRGKRERGKKGGRKQVAVPLLRKWALVSVKSQESKALSKDSSGQVRAVPPAGVTTLEGDTGGGGGICSLRCLLRGLLSAQHFWKPGHIWSPLKVFYIPVAWFLPEFPSGN